MGTSERPEPLANYRQPPLSIDGIGTFSQSHHPASHRSMQAHRESALRLMLPPPPAHLRRGRLECDQIRLVQQNRRWVERFALRLIVLSISSHIFVVSFDAVVVFGPWFDDCGSCGGCRVREDVDRVILQVGSSSPDRSLVLLRRKYKGAKMSAIGKLTWRQVWLALER